MYNTKPIQLTLHLSMISLWHTQPTDSKSVDPRAFSSAPHSEACCVNTHELDGVVLVGVEAVVDMLYS